MQPFFYMNQLPVYLDYNATTPVDKEVTEVMMRCFETNFGNPSSQHIFGAEARRTVEKAREQVASLVGASPGEIFFTSGATEANNLALRGFAMANKNRGNHIITSQIEHPAVLEVCKYLEKNGFIVSYLPVDQYGMALPESLEKAITPATILVSVMLANNETGTIQPIEEMAIICKKHHIAFHTDAAQTPGKIETRVDKLQVDMLSLAGHKFYAPKGIGALYIKRGTLVEKLIHGADHEQNMRAGTENVAYIAGLGMAAVLAERDLINNQLHYKRLTSFFYSTLQEAIPGLVLNGHPENRLSNTLNISIPGVNATDMLNRLSDYVAASTGAACHAQGHISGTLIAMHIDESMARSAIRFSFGKMTTIDEIKLVAEKIIQQYHQLSHNNKIVKTTGTAGKIKLTQFTTGLGCACKINPGFLEKILTNLPEITNQDLIIGTETSDDAAVYKINDEIALVSTVDFFTPIVDDPFYFGAIAAANALSDIYAMGAKPLFALNIAAFPAGRLPDEVLQEIIRGAASKLSEAGIFIAGGHTIDDDEPKFGLVINGVVHPKKILRNHGLKPGDVLILTKPLGTGIITTASKKGLASENIINEAINQMCQLNDKAAAIAVHCKASACTDITGFGLLGHLHEMISSSETDVDLNFKKIPFINGTSTMALAGAIPGGTKANLEYAISFTKFDPKISGTEKMMLSDAQTSGGLLFGVEENCAVEILEVLKQQGMMQATIIGRVRSGGKGNINVIYP